VLADSDLSPRNVRRLLDILSDVLKQSPTLSGSTGVAIAVERVLLRLLSSNPPASSPVNGTTDVPPSAAGFMPAIVSMVIARQSLGPLLQLVERVLLSDSNDSLQSAPVPVTPLTTLSNARGKFAETPAPATVATSAGGDTDGGLFSWYYYFTIALLLCYAKQD
jgi:hypothetical protein